MGPAGVFMPLGAVVVNGPLSSVGVLKVESRSGHLSLAQITSPRTSGTPFTSTSTSRSTSSRLSSSSCWRASCTAASAASS